MLNKKLKIHKEKRQKRKAQIQKAKDCINGLEVFHRAVGSCFTKDGLKENYGAKGMPEYWGVLNGKHFEFYFLETKEIEFGKHERRWIEFCEKNGWVVLFVCENEELVSKINECK